MDHNFTQNRTRYSLDGSQEILRAGPETILELLGELGIQGTIRHHKAHEGAQDTA